MPANRATTSWRSLFQGTLYDHEVVKGQTVTSYDAAYPPRVDCRVIQRFLGANFEPLYTNVVAARFTSVGAEFNTGFPYFNRHVLVLGGNARMVTSKGQASTAAECYAER